MTTVIREAAIAILLGSALAGVLWGVFTVVGPAAARRLRSPARARAAAWAPLAILAVSGAVAVAGCGRRPGRLGARRVPVLHRARAQSRRRLTRFASGGGNRYDYWRVAWHQFQDEPLRGLGAGNYDRTYFVERSTSEDIRQAHSIELQTLGELGLVGGMLLLAFFAAVGFGFARRARAARVDLRARGLAVAAGGAFTVWLVQTSVDWMHLIPGVTGIVLCSAAVLVGPWRSERGPQPGRARIVVVAAGAVIVVFGGGARGTRGARAPLRQRRPRTAGERIPRGRSKRPVTRLDLNDEALPAYYLEAAAWARLDDYARARAALDAAAAREPHDFVTYALLGDLARAAMTRQALRDYRRALGLNPRNEALAAAVAESRRRIRQR